MNRSRHALLLATAACLLFGNGCAVVMAVKGKADPNLGALEAGQDRAVAIATLGPPSKTYHEAGKRVDVFKLKRGDAPSAGRAIAHGAMDVFTLCLWEIVGTPIEASQGETFHMTVYYDEEDKIASMLPMDYGKAMEASGRKATGKKVAGVKPSAPARR